MAFAVLLAGCATQPERYFVQADGNPMPPMGSRIAVLCGYPDSITQSYASLVASTFRNSGSFAVLSDSDIRRVYKDYPVPIVSSRSSILESDIPHLVAIGEALSVDYVFTLWVNMWENSYNGVKQSFDIVFVGSLLSIKHGQYIGMSGFGWRERLPLIDADMKAQKASILESTRKAAELLYRHTMQAIQDGI